MPKPVGRPPKPVEQKRRAGNPGKRPLPDAVIAIPTSPTVPEPHRPLGQAGRQFWERVWNVGFTWISPQMDIELLQIVAEQIDERAALRVKVTVKCDRLNARSAMPWAAHARTAAEPRPASPAIWTVSSPDREGRNQRTSEAGNQRSPARPAASPAGLRSC